MDYVQRVYVYFCRVRKKQKNKALIGVGIVTFFVMINRRDMELGVHIDQKLAIYNADIVCLSGHMYRFS